MDEKANKEVGICSGNQGEGSDRRKRREERTLGREKTGRGKKKA